jgi:two-component system, cell cycle sensor histidine kinase and response regulator CckA
VKVLIAEDDRVTRRQMQALIEKWGYEAISVEDGTKAWQILEQLQAPPLVILDWMMPGMTGVEICRRLRETQANLLIYVILVTARDNPKDIIAGLEAGANDYLTKPFNRAELRTRLKAGERIVSLQEDLRQQLLELQAQREEQRQLQQYRDQLLNRLQLQVDRMPMGCILTDEFFRFNYLNPAAEKIFGYPLEELLNKTPWGLIIPESARPKVEELLHRAMSGDMTAHGTIDNLTKEGKSIICEWFNTPLIDQDGKFYSLLSMVQDLTEVKRSEDQLRKLSRAVEQSHAAIMITDTCGSIEYVNLKYQQLSGYLLEEIACRNPRFQKGGEIPPQEYTALWNTIQSGGEWRGELHNRKKTGELYWVAASISPIFSAEGVITNYLAIYEDISERKKQEEVLKQTEEQFRQSQKMEAIGSLAGGVAHDFNNLLSVIIGYADLMAIEVKKEDPLRNSLDQIRKAGQRAADLTRQLLAFSRKQVLQPRIFDLNSIITESSKMLQRLIGEDVALVTFLDPGLGRVKADPTQFTQVVLNMAVNARDAMPRGGKLTIETANVTLDEEYTLTHLDTKPGPYVLLTVSDTGCGITQEVLDHIFEPFYTTKERGKGTGLGLSTVYGIVKQSEGNIEVESTPGHGTIFRIYLPLVAALEENAKIQLKTEVRTRSETILLVEDDDMVRALAAHALRKKGYQVLEAANGGEALLICEQHPEKIHLLLTDVIMPHMSGRTLADKLSRMRVDMRILYMSGYTDNVIIPHGILESDISFLPKPFTPDELLQKVATTLDSNQ